MRSCARALLLGVVSLGTTTLGGCCGGSGDDPEPAVVTVHNQSAVWVHVLWETGSRLFLKPGGRVTMNVGDERGIEIVVAPGQGSYEGVVRTPINCCCTASHECEQKACGNLVVNPGTPVVVDYGAPECFPETKGNGSCPYVYAHDGKRFRAEGEVLSASLYAAMARVDHLPLPDLVPVDGRLQVRIATELPEVDVINRAELLVVDHAPGTSLAVDPGGALIAVGPGTLPLAVTDAEGRDRSGAVRGRGDSLWRGRFAASQPARLRDHLQVTFAQLAAGQDRARVVAMVQNGREAEEKLNRFLAELGPGLASLMGAASRMPGFATSIETRLRESGISMEVAFRQSDDQPWKTVAWIPPVGSLAARPVAIDLLQVQAGKEIQLRLNAAPGTWLVDEIRLHEGQVAMDAQVLAPTTAQDKTGGLSPLASGQPLRQVQGQSVTLGFAAPAPAPLSRVRSYALKVHGHYEMVSSGGFAIDWGLLRDRSVSGKDAFARYLRDGRSSDRWRFCPKKIVSGWFQAAESAAARTGAACVSIPNGWWR